MPNCKQRTTKMMMRRLGGRRGEGETRDTSFGKNSAMEGAEKDNEIKKIRKRLSKWAKEAQINCDLLLKSNLLQARKREVSGSLDAQHTIVERKHQNAQELRVNYNTRDGTGLSKRN